MYRILQQQGIPSKIIRLIKMTMFQTNAHIKIQGGISEVFVYNGGLKQGDGLAPMLFNLTLDWVIKQTELDLNNTLLYKSTQVVTYADDLDIMGRSTQRIEEVLGKLEQAANKVGLKINDDKTKWMVQTRNKNYLYNLMETRRFNMTEEFKYLGTTISSNNEEWSEIQRRITAANKTYFALVGILKSSIVHKEMKIRIYKTMIRTVLCYACETWIMNAKAETALGVFERKILRRIYGPVNDNGQWRIRYNHELMDLYKETDIVTYIKLKRLEWAGHVCRMGSQRVNKRIVEGRIYGRRPVGRPKDRWIDEVTKDAKQLLGITTWRRKALDREEWRKKIEEVKARFWAVEP